MKKLGVFAFSLLLILLGGCPNGNGSHPTPTPAPTATATAAPTQTPEPNWRKIAWASHRYTDTRKAPYNRKILGDSWGQFLTDPSSIEEMIWSLNVVRVGVETRQFDPYLRGQATIEQCLNSPARFGAPGDVGTATTYEQLMVSAHIGVLVMLTIDGSCNEPVSQYHRCSNGAIAAAPGTNRDAYGKIYRALLAWVEANIPNTVVAVEIENEPCYLAFTGAQYASLVEFLIPIIRESTSAWIVAAAGSGDACNYAVVDRGLPVDVVAFHVATPEPGLSDALFHDRARDYAKALRTRVGSSRRVWCTELGIGGEPHSAFNAAGAARLRAGIMGVFDGSGDGVFALAVGGLVNGPQAIPLPGQRRFDFYWIDRTRGKSPTVGMVQGLSRSLGIAWNP